MINARISYRGINFNVVIDQEHSFAAMPTGDVREGMGEFGVIMQDAVKVRLATEA